MVSSSVYISIVIFFTSSALVSCQYGCEFYEEFQEYKARYNKNYVTKRKEHKAYNAFAQNLKYILQHNEDYEAGRVRYHLEINTFSDMTPKQFAGMRNGFEMPKSKGNEGFLNLHPPLLPEKLDWREKGAVTPVKDQLGCGACWAFSAAQALESKHFIKTGKLVSLSEQNLIDCSWLFNNSGCVGGSMTNAYEYIMWNKGISSEKSYPYDASMGICRYNKTDIGATMSKFLQLDEGHEESMKFVVAEFGPVAAAIDGSHSSWMHYKGGIYEDKDCRADHLDHAVTVVGYGSDGGHDYWIVKNSYGTDWGLNGYALMRRNHNNSCGIASHAIVPLIL